MGFSLLVQEILQPAFFFFGRVDMARLFLERGADPVEADAEAWATPRAWANRKGNRAILALLDEYKR